MVHAPYTCLWFSSEADEAAEYYCSVFNDSELVSTSPIVSIFRLSETKFMALNGRTGDDFNESASIVVECDTQEEIDQLWDTLTEEGEESMCGWLRDKYGVSWQIVPSILGTLMSDPERGQRVVQAFLQMRKFDIAALLNA